MQWVSRGSSCALSTDLLYRIVHPDVRKSLIQPNIPLRAEWLCHAGVSALVADNPHNPTGTVRDRSGHTQNPTAFNEATNFLRSGCTKVSNMLVDSASSSTRMALWMRRKATFISPLTTTGTISYTWELNCQSKALLPREGYGREKCEERNSKMHFAETPVI